MWRVRRGLLQRHALGDMRSVRTGHLLPRERVHELHELRCRHALSRPSLQSVRDVPSRDLRAPPRGTVPRLRGRQVHQRERHDGLHRLWGRDHHSHSRLARVHPLQPWAVPVRGGVDRVPRLPFRHVDAAGRGSSVQPLRGREAYGG